MCVCVCIGVCASVCVHRPECGARASKRESGSVSYQENDWKFISIGDELACGNGGRAADAHKYFRKVQVVLSLVDHWCGWMGGSPGLGDVLATLSDDGHVIN